ncbi:MAG TPA: phosphoserine phosphatase SerB [Xanthobacteraceae bacterium]|jgi:phosphoserine phosphatase
MPFVATFISDPAKPALSERTIERARSTLCSLGARPGAAVWLEAEIAADLFFDAESDVRGPAAEGLRAAVADESVDVIVQSAASRRKKLLLADMDSTMVGQECIDELADFAGVKPQVAAITERAMRGEIEFAGALRERVRLLKGLPAAAITEVIKSRIRVSPGAVTLVATMRSHGAYTCLVTGGFTAFSEPVEKMIGFQENHANRLLMDTQQRLTGEVEEPIFARESKLAALINLRQRLHVRAEDTLAVGDGANDIEMLQAAGLGIAYHAKPKVAAAAASRIDYADLTALLYAQGYRRGEFVEALQPG